MAAAPRKPYPSDASDEKWAFVAPYLTLVREDAPQRYYPLREVFNGLRWFVRAGADWRRLPHDMPHWHTVYQQTRHWLAAEVFEDLAQGRAAEPRAAVEDCCTLQSSPKSGAHTGYDGAKRSTGSTGHLAVDTLATCWHW